jgi:16S rRNA G1207 methylase RsmC
LGEDALAQERFAAAACWPRAHLGIDFSMANLAYGALHLKPGGTLYCAARKQKGGKRLGSTMEALLGNVRVQARERGYHLYLADRGGKRLDAGTAVLLSHLTRMRVRAAAQVRRIVDLGAGIGPLGLWAAREFPQARVLAVDASYLATALVAENARRASMEDRIDVVTCDGLGHVPDALAGGYQGRTDLFLINPPTHASPAGLDAFLQPVAGWLSPAGRALVVVNRAGRATEALSAAGLVVESHEYPGYWVLEAHRP